MVPICLLFPDAARLLAFRPQDLALVLVEYFKQLPTQDRWMASRCAVHWAAGYPVEVRDVVARHLLVAWRWLREHGYLARDEARLCITSPDRHAAGARGGQRPGGEGTPLQGGELDELDLRIHLERYAPPEIIDTDPVGSLAKETERGIQS